MRHIRYGKKFKNKSQNTESMPKDSEHDCSSANGAEKTSGHHYMQLFTKITSIDQRTTINRLEFSKTFARKKVTTLQQEVF